MYTMYLDDKLLYAPNVDLREQYIVTSPKLTMELGKSGSLNFIVAPGNPLYNKFRLMKTVVTVYRDDNVLWKGRVIESTPTFYRNKEIVCEGILGYLNDSIQKPASMTTTLSQLFTTIIDNHNKMVEPFKRFTIGAFTMPDYEIEYNESYVKSMSLLSDLLSQYGGYIDVTYSDEANLINWFSEVTQVGDQVIRFGENLLDLQEHVSGTDVVTCIIPIGKDGITLADEFVKNNVGCDLFGQIWDYLEINDLDDPTEIRAYAQAYVDQLAWASMEVNIGAVDLSLLGYSVDSIDVGKKYRTVSPPHNMDYQFPCSKAELDLCSPGNNTYTLGAQTIWTQIDDARDYSEMIRDTTKFKTLSDQSLTARNSVAEGIIKTRGSRYSGTVQFSDNTNLRFENGICVGGSSSEGEF